MIQKLLLACVFIIMVQRGGAGDAYGPIPPQILKECKSKQKEDYDKCKVSYEYWKKEADRLSKYPDSQSSLERAQTKANDMAAKAKRILSEENFQSIVKSKCAIHFQKETAHNKDVQAQLEREQRAKAIEAAKFKAEAARRIAMQKAAEERVEAKVAVAKERAEARARLEAEDQETMGVLTPDKFERIVEDYSSLDDVEKILGEGKITRSSGQADRYDWYSDHGDSHITIIVDKARIVRDKTAAW